MAKIIFGLIGASLRHSLSPIIHNAVFKRLSIGARYQLFELKQRQLKSFLNQAFGKSIRGLNVTIPYKEDVMPFLTRLDADTTGAFAMGAVNTIRVEDREIIGYNTDGDGFIDALLRIERRTRNKQFKFRDKVCVILGAGGAAKSVAFALATNAVEKIHVYDINGPKARNLVLRIKDKFPRCACEVLNKDQLNIVGDSHILVNATPVGMKATDKLVLDLDYLHKDLFVFDCVYNPQGRKTTILVEKAREAGLRAFDGLWMLICQAIRSEKIWLGRQIPEDEIFNTMRCSLEEAGFNLC